MVRIGKLAISQPVNLQATQAENQESVSNQTQTTETSNTPKSSANTWQRAGLEQDGLMQQSVQYRHLREKIEQSNVEKKKDGLRDLINTANDEIKKLQAELDEVYDSNFVSTADWFSGRDKGAEESNVSRITTKKQSAKDDDD